MNKIALALGKFDGLHRGHIRVLKESNADALLIGTAFMESENPMELALHWKDIYNG